MAGRSRVELPVLPEELEFFAEEEKIQIVPNFTLDEINNTVVCIGGDYGPIRAAIPVEVPIWMALQLHKRGKCSICVPDWLRPDHLKRVIENEQTDGSMFQPLPFYYMEIACLLFAGSRTSFGTQFAQVRDLLQRLANIRRHKIEEGLKDVSSAVTVKMVNLGAFEANLIRMNLQGTFNTFVKMDQVVKDIGPASSSLQYTASGF